MLWQAPMDLVDIPNSELLVTNNEHLIYSGERTATAISVDDGSLVWKSDIYDGRALRSYYLLHSKQQNQIFGNHFHNIMVWDANNGQLMYELSDSLDGIKASIVSLNTLIDQGYAFVGIPDDLVVLDWESNIKYSIDCSWRAKTLIADNNERIFRLFKYRTWRVDSRSHSSF